LEPRRPTARGRVPGRRRARAVALRGACRAAAGWLPGGNRGLTGGSPMAALHWSGEPQPAMERR